MDAYERARRMLEQAAARPNPTNEEWDILANRLPPLDNSGGPPIVVGENNLGSDLEHAELLAAPAPRKNPRRKAPKQIPRKPPPPPADNAG